MKRLKRRVWFRLNLALALVLLQILGVSVTLHLGVFAPVEVLAARDDAFVSGLESGGMQQQNLQYATVFSNVIYLPLVWRSSLQSPVLFTPSVTCTMEESLFFDWSDVEGVAGYRFQLSTSKDFSLYLVEHTVLESQLIVTDVHKQGTYYWRVGSISSDSSDEIFFSEARLLNLVIQQDPGLDEPINTGEELVQLSPAAFTWSPIEGATGYQFQLSASADFNTPLVDQIVSTNEFVYNDSLTGPYYWRVRAINELTEGPYSKIYSIYFLGSPQLISPTYNSSQAQPLFDWTDVISATEYQFQLAADSDFTSPLITQTLTASQFTYTDHLTGTYYWRVYASYQNKVGRYSEVWPIRLIDNTAPPLDQVVLVAPVDNSQHVRVTFDWDNVVDATRYQFQLAPTSDFNQPAIDQVVTTTELDYLSVVSGTHYWRVKALSDLSEGPYSELRTINLFQIDRPTLLTPADGSPQARVKFDWQDLDNVTGYQFQLSASNTFGTLLVDQTLASSEYTFTEASTINGTYYWRVFGLNNQLIGPASETRSVKIVKYYDDDDGDNLPNGWELHGYDADNDDLIDIDLPALGASYQHRDLFVEMDYMERASATNGLAPNETVLNNIRATFANAPLSNPDGIDGITIHLDLDDPVPYDDTFSWDSGNVGEFYQLKDQYFDPKRQAIYHYMIWANTYSNHNSEDPAAMGYSRRVPGVDFFVTLGSFNGGAGGTDTQKTVAFIHELGHNLGLYHGGHEAENYKPNYISVMNYSWAATGIYYEEDGVGEYLFDYQRFDLPNALNEKNNHLNEGIGLDNSDILQGYYTKYHCPDDSVRTVAADGPIDWNCDGDTDDTDLSLDVNNDNELKRHESFSDWANLIFDGGGIIGAY